VTLLTIGPVTIPASTGVTSAGYVIDGSGKSLSMRGWGGGYNAPVGFGWAYAQIGTCYSFWRGTQNVNLQYTAGFSGVPYDLEEMVRLVAAQNVRRRSWIDQKSQTLAGQETIIYRDWDIPPNATKVIEYYKTRAVF